MSRLLTFLIYLVVLPVQANTDLLDQIDQRLDHFPITRGEFTQENYLKVLRKPLISSGNFILHEEKGVNWLVKHPMRSQVLMNQKRVVSSDHSVQFSGMGGFGEIFQSLLSGNLSSLAQHFDIGGQINSQNWQLILLPKEIQFSEIVQKVHLSGNRQVQELELHYNGGDRTRIDISAISHSTHLSASEDAEFIKLNP